MKQRSEMYDELSHPNVDPYFGEMHAQPACDESTIPAPRALKVGSNFGRLYHFYSGAGGALKTCDPQVGTKTQVLFLYCDDDKKLYEYRHQYDFGAVWKQDPAVSCRN